MIALLGLPDLLQDTKVVFAVRKRRNRVYLAVGFHNFLQQLRRKVVDDVPSPMLKVCKRAALFNSPNVQTVSM
ncbi:MAG: hypothetical protein A3I93_02210 [Candidatus Magasanikbacteria bacterium RIFCSPLOWO2_02_FULL_43_22]|nr:MAG: hypothetical protein A3I93_02210 [Candidatus Magasanikbacteria bacterium RIFCSPLOWO2_02_FULL_43_22]